MNRAKLKVGPVHEIKLCPTIFIKEVIRRFAEKKQKNELVDILYDEKNINQYLIFRFFFYYPKPTPKS